MREVVGKEIRTGSRRLVVEGCEDNWCGVDDREPDDDAKGSFLLPPPKPPKLLLLLAFVGVVAPLLARLRLPPRLPPPSHSPTWFSLSLLPPPPLPPPSWLLLLLFSRLNSCLLALDPMPQPRRRLVDLGPSRATRYSGRLTALYDE